MTNLREPYVGPSASSRSSKSSGKFPSEPAIIMLNPKYDIVALVAMRDQLSLHTKKATIFKAHSE